MHHFAKQLNLLLILPVVLSSTSYKGNLNFSGLKYQIRYWFIVRCHINIKYFTQTYSIILEPLVLEDSSQFFLPEHPGEPQFAEGVETNVNVTGQLGGSVFLHCPVVNSGDRAVSYPSVSTIIYSWHAPKILSSFSFINFIF